MSWIQRIRRKDGSCTFWVRDIRVEGEHRRQVVIFAGLTQGEADNVKEQYDIRRDLEKEGYEDEYADVYDTDQFIEKLKRKGGGEG